MSGALVHDSRARSDLTHARVTHCKDRSSDKDTNKCSAPPILAAVAKYFGSLYRLPLRSAIILTDLFTLTGMPSPHTGNSCNNKPVLQCEDGDANDLVADDTTGGTKDHKMSVLLSYNFTITALSMMHVIDLRPAYLGARQVLALADLLRVDRWHCCGKPSQVFWAYVKREEGCTMFDTACAKGNTLACEYDHTTAKARKTYSTTTVTCTSSTARESGQKTNTAAELATGPTRSVPALFAGCTLFPCLRVLSLSNLGLDFDNTEDGECLDSASCAGATMRRIPGTADPTVTALLKSESIMGSNLAADAECDVDSHDRSSRSGVCRQCGEDSIDGNDKNNCDRHKTKQNDGAQLQCGTAVETTRPSWWRINGNAVVSYLLQALHGHPSLCELDLSDNPIGPAMLPNVVALLDSTPTLTCVNLRNTLLLRDEMSIVDALCERNRHLVERAECDDGSIASCTAWQHQQIEWITTYQRRMMQLIHLLSCRKKAITMYPSSNQAAPGSTQPTTSEDVVSTEHARASTPVSAVDHEATKPASQPQMSTPTMVFTRQCTGSAHQRTPTPISNYAGLNFSTTSKGDNIAQLRFTDSPIEVKCRTRGGSRSPFLSTFQTELKFDLDLSNSHACGLALSERTSPVQATTPIFDSTGCGSFPQVVSRRVGNEAALLAPCPTRPRGDGARLTTVGAVPQSRTDDDDSRRGSQPVTHPSPMGHSRTAPTEESHDTQSGAAVLADWLALPNAAEANALCEEAGEPNSANSVAQAIAPAAPLPASVVHRVLQGRCRFIAFPTNLPVVLCKNSINTTAGSGPTSGSINSSSECHNNNANNTTNYSCTTTVTGSPVSGPMECCGFAHSGSDSQEKGATTHESASTMTAGTGSAHAGVHASTVTAPPASAVSTTNSNVMSKQISKSSFKEVTHALFIGQVRFETTPAELIWLVQRTTGACVSYLESRGAGCYLLYCKSEADLQLVRCLHKRILFDIGGVWLARTAEEIDALCEHIALDAAVLSRKARLPRDSMVVEDLKVDALDSNKHHSGGGGSSNNCSFNHGAAVGCLDYPGSKSFTHAKQSYHTRQPHHTSHHNSYSKCSNSVVNNPLSTYSNFSNDPSQCCTPRTRSKLIGTTVGNLNSSLDVACCTVSGQLAPQTYPSSQFTYPCNTMGACTESNNNNNSYAAHMSRHVACCEDMTGYLADSRCYSECMPIGTATATVSLSQHPRQSYQTIDAAPIMPNSAAQMGTKPNCPQECASPQPPPYRF